MLNWKKRSKKLNSNYLSCIVFCLFFTFSFSSVNADEFWLLSNDEYNQIKSLDTNFAENLSTSITNGPVIKIVEPKVIEKVSSPVNIKLQFLPSSNGYLPNMKSLIVHMKGLITLDITQRVEKFIKGNEIYIKDANIPKGRHKILFMIVDEANQYSEKLVSFKVS